MSRKTWYATGNNAGGSSVLPTMRLSQGTTSRRLPYVPKVPSFVRSCERSLTELKREKSRKRETASTSRSGEERRKAARVDANQSLITKALRSVGAFVQPLQSIGQGCPDLLVAYRGKWAVLEVKDGDKPPCQRKLTKDEQEWHEQVGSKAPVFIVENVEDALVAIGAVTLKD